MAPQELDVRGELSLDVGTVLPCARESAGVSQDSCQINHSHAEVMLCPCQRRELEGTVK